MPCSRHNNVHYPRRENNPSVPAFEASSSLGHSANAAHLVLGGLSFLWEFLLLGFVRRGASFGVTTRSSAVVLLLNRCTCMLLVVTGIFIALFDCEYCFCSSRAVDDDTAATMTMLKRSRAG